MARKKSKTHRMKKIRPMELDLWFDAQSGFVDLAQAASLVNRVSLRQGYQYAIDSISLYGTPGSTANQSVTVHRLPNHWPMVNSWVRSYHAWQRSEHEKVIEDNPSLPAKYRDFKICFNTAHAPNASSNWPNKLPLGYATTGGTSSYEWQASQIAIPNDGGVAGQTEEYFLHVLGADLAPTGVGADDGSKGMIHGYAQARSRPQTQDPNVVTTESWLIQLFDDGENAEEIWTNVREKNDEPPYLIDQEPSGSEYYPGGANQGQSAGEQASDLQCTQYQRVSHSPGFLANCGLLAILGTGDNLDTARIRVRLVPGPYKGLLARPMHEVN